MKRFKVIAVALDEVIVEDVLGIRQEDGTFPRTNYYVDTLESGFQVGDWVGFTMFLQERPVRKETQESLAL